jgi:hypothetical protein
MQAFETCLSFIIVIYIHTRKVVEKKFGYMNRLL